MKWLMYTLYWTDAAYSWSVDWQTAKLVAVHKSRLRVRLSRLCGAQAAKSIGFAKAGLGGENQQFVLFFVREIHHEIC